MHSPRPVLRASPLATSARSHWPCTPCGVPTGNTRKVPPLSSGSVWWAGRVGRDDMIKPALAPTLTRAKKRAESEPRQRHS
eukprot:scaffold63720_cov63-Phaeocystis_antarctica.AAC.3